MIAPCEIQTLLSDNTPACGYLTPPPPTSSRRFSRGHAVRPLGRLITLPINCGGWETTRPGKDVNVWAATEEPRRSPLKMKPLFTAWSKWAAWLPGDDTNFDFTELKLIRSDSVWLFAWRHAPREHCSVSCCCFLKFLRRRTAATSAVFSSKVTKT